MSKVSVLVVDDAPFIRDLVKKCLRNDFPGMRHRGCGQRSQGPGSCCQLRGVRPDAVRLGNAGDVGLELLHLVPPARIAQGHAFIMVTSRGDKEMWCRRSRPAFRTISVSPFTNEAAADQGEEGADQAGKLDALLASAPTRATSAFANDSLTRPYRRQGQKPCARLPQPRPRWHGQATDQCAATGAAKAAAPAGRGPGPAAPVQRQSRLA